MPRGRMKVYLICPRHLTLIHVLLALANFSGAISSNCLYISAQYEGHAGCRVRRNIPGRGLDGRILYPLEAIAF